MQSMEGFEPTFASLEDTPHFRHKVAEVEATVGALEARSAALVRAGRRYLDGLAAMAEAQQEFADFLEGSFGDRSNPLNYEIGGNLVGKFGAVFRELASFGELLRTQADLSLCERLQTTWSGGVLQAAREAKRTWEKAEVAATGGGLLASRDKRRAAAARADDARLDLAARLQLVESRKRYEFLEALATSMEAHLRFTERNYEVLKNIEPFIHFVQREAAGLKADQVAKEAELSEAAADLRALQIGLDASRGGRPAGAAAAASGEAGPGRDFAPGAGDGAVGPPDGWEPPVLSGIAEACAATAASGAASIQVLRAGHLLKRSSGMLRDWQRRWFVLDSQGMLYYHSDKGARRDGRLPGNTLFLLSSKVTVAGDSAHAAPRFTVASPEKTFQLAAESEAELRDWVTAIQMVISCVSDQHNTGADAALAPAPSLGSQLSSQLSRELSAAQMGAHSAPEDGWPSATPPSQLTATPPDAPATPAALSPHPPAAPAAQAPPEPDPLDVVSRFVAAPVSSQPQPQAASGRAQAGLPPVPHQHRRSLSGSSGRLLLRDTVTTPGGERSPVPSSGGTSPSGSPLAAGAGAGGPFKPASILKKSDPALSMDHLEQPTRRTATSVLGPSNRANRSHRGVPYFQ